MYIRTSRITTIATSLWTVDKVSIPGFPAWLWLWIPGSKLSPRWMTVALHLSSLGRTEHQQSSHHWLATSSFLSGSLPLLLCKSQQNPQDVLIWNDWWSDVSVSSSTIISVSSMLWWELVVASISWSRSPGSCCGSCGLASSRSAWMDVL